MSFGAPPQGLAPPKAGGCRVIDQQRTTIPGYGEIVFDEGSLVVIARENTSDEELQAYRSSDVSPQWVTIGSSEYYSVMPVIPGYVKVYNSYSSALYVWYVVLDCG